MTVIENDIRALRPPADRDRPLILIADDDRTYRFLYRQALEAAGFGVVEAVDGADALAVFEKSAPAIVVLDVLMPKMGGFAACAALRATKAGRSAPVLLATTLDDIGSIERAYDAGATDFITKPVNWKILVQRIRYMLRADDAFRGLAESERRLAEAQRLAGLGNFFWPVGAGAVQGSDELSRVLGLARPGSGALPLRRALRKIPASGRREFLRAVRATLRGGATLRHDLAIVDDDDSERNVEIRGAIVADHAGRPAIRGTAQDITERKRTEAALISARRAAESADAVKTALLAGANHELRTPLNAIIGFAEMISGEILGPIGEARYREFAGDILIAGRHMLDLVSNVLDMAKLSSDQYELTFEPEDIRQLVLKAATAVGNSPIGRGHAIALADGRCPEHVSVDARAVHQMLIHLLSNAVKFSPPEAPVEMTCTQTEAGELWLSVADRGIGMTEEEIEAAVQPFRQIDSRLERKYEGLGIGLAIVSKLIAGHGGRLVIASMPGEGSRFSLVFPKERVIADAAAVALALQGGSGS